MAGPVVDAGFLAPLLTRIEALERLHRLLITEVDRLRDGVVGLDRVLEAQEETLRALRVAARGDRQPV